MSHAAIITRQTCSVVALLLVFPCSFIICGTVSRQFLWWQRPRFLHASWWFAVGNPAGIIVLASTRICAYWKILINKNKSLCLMVNHQIMVKLIVTWAGSPTGQPTQQHAKKDQWTMVILNATCEDMRAHFVALRHALQSDAKFDSGIAQAEESSPLSAELSTLDFKGQALDFKIRGTWMQELHGWDWESVLQGFLPWKFYVETFAFLFLMETQLAFFVWSWLASMRAVLVADSNS